MKKNDGWTDLVSCPECEADVDVAYYPGQKAQTYGPPENCYPEEPSDLDCPDECQKCGEKFGKRVRDRWLDQIEERRCDRDDY